MQKLKNLLGILAIGLFLAVTLPAQNSGTFQGQVIQPDGKILIWGSNIVVSGIPSGMAARLNSNGSRDATFNFCGCQFVSVNRLVLQPDGKILVSGNQDSGGIFMRQRLARINADGSADSTFTPYEGTAASSVSLTVEGVQPDGKILAYSIVDAGFPFGASTNVLRFNPDGSRDNPFGIFIGQGHFFRTYMGDLKILPDGKFYISTVPAISAGIPTLKRYNADGSLDPAWAPPVWPTGFDAINSLESQPNGDVVAAGRFSQINGVNANSIARLKSNGSVDPAFTASGFPLSLDSVTLLPDGKFLLRVQLTADPLYTFGIRRLNADGSLDPAFEQSPSITAVTSAFSVDAQGRIVFAGSHSTQGNGYYRLNPNGDLDGTFIFGFKRPDFDFDGDGKTDVGVFRPSEGNWYLSQSQNGFSVQNFGLNGDVITPGDFDGDRKTDLAIWRPGTGTWWYKSSINGGFYAVQWGQAGDIPLAEDFNGDGRADFVYYRPSNSTWHRLGSTGGYSAIAFGTAGDIPLVADMDGDGKADPTIYRPSTGTWWYASSVNGLFYAIQWGSATDIPVPGDYDGDGKTDPAYFRPSDGAWFALQSGTNYTTYTGAFWGMTGDRPTAADYDGDGKTDLAIYRPSNGMWFALRSTSGFFSQQFGLPGDKAVPNAFLP